MRACVWPDGCMAEGRYVIQPGGDHRPDDVYCGTHLNQLGGTVIAVQLAPESGPVCDFCSGAPTPWVLRTRGDTMVDMLAVDDDDRVTRSQLSNMGDTWAVCDGCKPFIDAVLQGITDDAMDLFFVHVRESNPAVWAALSDPEGLRSALVDMWGTVFGAAVWPLARADA